MDTATYSARVRQSTRVSAQAGNLVAAASLYDAIDGHYAGSLAEPV